MNLNKLIGAGANSKVYDIDDHRVLKLYNSDQPFHIHEREYMKTCNAVDAGLPAPKVYEKVCIDGQYGLVMDKVNGLPLSSVLYDIKSDFENNNEKVLLNKMQLIARKTAEALASVHTIETELPETSFTMINEVEGSIKQTDLLTQSEKNNIIQYLHELPHMRRVCHGDPNANNIITYNDTVCMIDWMNTGTGHPLYDVTEFMLLLWWIPMYTVINEPIRHFFSVYRDLLERTFFEYYKSLTDIDPYPYEAWILPMLAAKIKNQTDPITADIMVAEVRKRL